MSSLVIVMAVGLRRSMVGGGAEELSVCSAIETLFLGISNGVKVAQTNSANRLVRKSVVLRVCVIIVVVVARCLRVWITVDEVT